MVRMMISDSEGNHDNSSQMAQRCKENKNSKGPKLRRSKYQNTKGLTEIGSNSKMVVQEMVEEGEGETDVRMHTVMNQTGCHRSSIGKRIPYYEQTAPSKQSQPRKATKNNFFAHHVSKSESRFNPSKVVAQSDQRLSHTSRRIVGVHHSDICLEDVENQIRLDSRLFIDHGHDSIEGSDMTSPAGLISRLSASCSTSNGALGNDSNFFDDFASFAGASLSTGSIQGSSIESWEKPKNGKVGTYLEPIPSEFLISYMVSTGVSIKNAEHLASTYSTQGIQLQRLPKMNLFKSSRRSGSAIDFPRSFYDAEHISSESTDPFFNVQSQHSLKGDDNTINESAKESLEPNGIGSTKTLITSNTNSSSEREVESMIHPNSSQHGTFRIVFAAGLLLMFMTALSTYLITSLLVSHEKVNGNSSDISEADSLYISQDIVDVITALTGRELVYMSPQFMAMAWLSRTKMFHDHLSNSSLAQRFTLATFFYSLHGDQWFDTGNWLNPQVHECNWSSGITCQTDTKDDRIVIEIDLTHNYLKGELPPEVGLLSSLEKLLLSKNLIVGTITSELFSIQALKEIDISYNSLSGMIPENIGQASNLQCFRMFQNRLQGAITPNISKLNQLHVLDLHSNEFSGTIPETLSSLTLLNTLNLRNNSFSGSIPKLGSDMRIDFLYLE
jgi:hypothetical protein